MPTPFPFDVWGVVVDCLRSGNPSDQATTFQAASLVCSEFRPIFQELLYRQFSLTIITFGTTTTVERLQGLSKTPRLISYIRDFSIRLADSMSTHGANRAGWMSKHGDLLAYFLRTLPVDQLEALLVRDWTTFCSVSQKGSGLNTSCERLREALRNLQKGCRLQRLKITNFPVVDMIAFGPSLKHLAVKDGNGCFANEPPGPQQSPQAPAMLESLESYGSTYPRNIPSIHHYLLQANGPISLCQLRRLVWNHREKVDEVRQIVRECRLFLEYLEIHIGQYLTQIIKDEGVR
jgi:hypothetical protein